MKTKSYINKEDWGKGPWQKEPDLAYWIEQDSGYHCAINRNPNTGSLCGYVGIPEDHPYVGTDYGAPDLEVHGGISYTRSKCPIEFGEHPEMIHLVSLIYSPSWWFGFDCAHAGDFMPAGPTHTYFRAKEYRTFNYVMDQVVSLDRQLHTIDLNQGTK